MTSVLLVPGRALGRARALGPTAGWELEPLDVEADVGSALAAGAGGSSVLFIPPGARVPRKLRRILVPHEGSPGATSGVEAADVMSSICGAEIVVLHVPTFEVPTVPGSLAAPRFVDRPQYDWAAWRNEFERRFCRCSDGVQVSLRVATGPPAPAILDAARRLRADLIVLAWKGEAGPGRADTLKGVLEAAPCPILIVPERAAAVRRPTTYDQLQ